MLNSASSASRIITNTNERVNGYSAISLDDSGIQELVAKFASRDKEELEKQLPIEGFSKLGKFWKPNLNVNEEIFATCYTIHIYYLLQIFLKSLYKTQPGFSISSIITALKALETIEDGKANLEKMVESANENTKAGLENNFIEDGFNYNSTGNYFTKELLEDVTSLGGKDYYHAKVDGYQTYDKPKDLQDFRVEINGKTVDELDDEDFYGMRSLAIERKISSTMETLSKIRQRIFGQDKEPGEEKEYTTLYADDTWMDAGAKKEKSGEVSKRVEIKDGEFNKHVGYAPTLKSSPDIKKTGSTEIFKNTNVLFEGEGEMGRIMLEFMRFQMMQKRGWGEFAKPLTERRIFDDDGIPDGFWTGWMKNWTMSGALDLATEIIISVASKTMGPFVHLAKLGGDAAKMLGDISRGRDAGEAAVDLGKAALKAGASVGLSFASIGGKIAEKLGGGFIADGVGAVASNVVSTQANSIVNSVNYSADGGWGFDTAGYLTSSFGAGALASYAGSFAGAAVGSGLSNWVGEVEAGFWGGAIDFGSSLAAKGASLGVYALAADEGDSFADIWDRSGGLSINVADFGTIANMFGASGNSANALKGIGINLNITSKGIGSSLATHSDIGLMSNIYDLGKGLSMRNWAKKESAKITESGLEGENFYEGIGYNYTFGDSLNLQTLERLKEGLDSYSFEEVRNDEGEIARALTTADKSGRRHIQFSNIDSGEEFAVDLAHESYRDGYTNVGTYETAQAVLSHTRMAQAIMKANGAGVFSNRDDLGLEAYILNNYGAGALANYAAQAYDNSGDYYLYDEKTNIVYPDGRYGVYSLQTGELLQASEFEEYDEDGNVTKQLPGSFSMELGKLFGMIPEGVSLEDVNPHHLQKVQKLLAENGYSWDSSEVREFAESVRNGKYVQNLQLPYPMGVDGQIGIQGNAYLATKFGLLSGEGISQTIGLMDFITNNIQIMDKYNNVAGVVSFAYGRNQERTDVINVENLTPENDRLNAGKIVVNQDGFVAMFPLSTTLPDVAQRGEDHAIIQDGTYRYMTEYHYLADGRKWDGLRLFDFSSLTKNLTEADKKNYRSNFPAYYYDNGIKKYTTTDKINDHRSSWKNGYWLTKTEGQYENFDAGSLGCQLTYGPIYDDYFSLFNRYDLGYYTIYRPFGDTIYDY